MVSAKPPRHTTHRTIGAAQPHDYAAVAAPSPVETISLGGARPVAQELKDANKAYYMHFYLY